MKHLRIQCRKINLSQGPKPKMYHCNLKNLYTMLHFCFMCIYFFVLLQLIFFSFVFSFFEKFLLKLLFPSTIHFTSEMVFGREVLYSIVWVSYVFWKTFWRHMMQNSIPDLISFQILHFKFNISIIT